MTATLTRCDEQIETMEAAGFGALQAPGGNLPLSRIDVKSHVSGLACQTTIRQVFRNPHQEFVEATYIFPLPGRFAVTACSMRLKDRVITADLQERSQARATYQRAISEGRRASIAEEERSETFSLRVGNIPPQEEVTVELTLAGMLSVVAGEATLRIPLVVAPRYVPGSPLDGPSVGPGAAVDTDEVPDASRVTPPTLLPGFPNPVALSIEVELDLAAFKTDAPCREAIRSSLHSVFVSESNPYLVRVLPGERVNRDFILRFPILPLALSSSLEYSHPSEKQAGSFALTVLPPATPTAAPRPRDVVFVLDRSGSMEGWKMVAARRAVARMIDSLRDDDRFRVLAFDDRMEVPQGGVQDWHAATDRNRWRTAEWIAKIESRGGTELGGALRSALQPFATFGMPAERDAIVVLITDGQVSGEDSVLRTIGEMGFPRLPRIFTLGIDRAVNASMLTRLAEMGGGSFEIVESEDRLDRVLGRFQREIGSPVLTELEIQPLDFDLVGRSVTPERLPDVFADRPLTIRGRVAGRRESIRLRLTGRDAMGAPWQQELTARRTDEAMLLPLWGRGRVRDLEDRYARGDQDKSRLQTEIVAVSLESHVLSRFTAYVAVDNGEVVNPGGSQHEIVQPVEEPEGWKMSRGAVACFRSLSPPVPMACAPPSSIDDDDSSSVDLACYAMSLDDDTCAMIDTESADSMLQEFTDTAISFTETEADEFALELPDDASPVVKLVNLILSEAVQMRASHVYLRPEETQLSIEYLIDGQPLTRDCPPRMLLSAIVSRLKILAGLDLASNELQTGHFSLPVGQASCDARVYVVPTMLGPSVVLRLIAQPYAGNKPARVPAMVERWLSDAKESCAASPQADLVYQNLVADSL